MLALSCLDKLIELDPHTSWVSFLSSRGYLKHLIDSLLDSERKLLSVLEAVPATLRPLYLYESKMVSRAKTMRSMKIGTFRHEWVNLLTCLTFLPFFHFFFLLLRFLSVLFFIILLPSCVCVRANVRAYVCVHVFFIFPVPHSSFLEWFPFLISFSASHIFSGAKSAKTLLT
jgi:hypothetical protein